MLALICRSSNIAKGCRTSFSIFLSQYYSTAASAAAQPVKNNFLENFLIETLGFSPEEAIQASTGTRVRRSENSDLGLVVDYFRDLGFGRTHIKRIVISYPDILFTRLDKTLKPKIQALQDLGLSGSDLARVLMSHRNILARGLDSYIKPRIEILRNLLGSDEKVALALRRCSFFFGSNVYGAITGIVRALHELGLSDENVARLILANPRSTLWLKPDRIKEIGQRVENHLGIPSNSNMFVYGFLVMSSCKESTIELKRAVFRSFGWSDVEIKKLFKTSPMAMMLSEAKIKEVLCFYMEQLGYSAAYMVSHPAFFGIGLETRVKPRIEVLKALDNKQLRKKKSSLYTAVCCTESKFIENYLLPYKKEIPDVYETYMRARSEG